LLTTAETRKIVLQHYSWRKMGPGPRRGGEKEKSQNDGKGKKVESYEKWEKEVKWEKTVHNVKNGPGRGGRSGERQAGFGCCRSVVGGKGKRRRRGGSIIDFKREVEFQIGVDSKGQLLRGFEGQVSRGDGKHPSTALTGKKRGCYGAGIKVDAGVQEGGLKNRSATDELLGKGGG